MVELDAISNGYLWSVTPREENYELVEGDRPLDVANASNVFVRGNWILDYEVRTEARMVSSSVDKDRAIATYELGGKEYTRTIHYDGNTINDTTDLPDAEYAVIPRGETAFQHRLWGMMPSVQCPPYEKVGDRYQKTGLDGVERSFSYDTSRSNGRCGLSITVDDRFPDKEFVDPQQWAVSRPAPNSGNARYDDAFQGAVDAIAQLVTYVPIEGDRQVRALVAGYPVFPSVFGRDSDITNFGLVYVDPDLVHENVEFRLTCLGTKIDHSKSEEPGKAVHEYNIDELTESGSFKRFPNYIGTDESPLLGISVARYTRIAEDDALLDSRAAELGRLFTFIRDHEDADGLLSFKGDDRDPATGEPVYFTRYHTWRDADNSVLHPEGQHPDQPLRVLWDQLCLYGMYEEFHRLASGDRTTNAKLSSIIGVDDASAFLASKRDALKLMINEKYWMDDLDAYAIALDKDGDQVRTVNSDVCMGLYYRAFDNDKAHRLIGNVLSDPDRLGDKFGMRTISKEHGSYAPDGYHLGGVWPFQSPFAAVGARNYGEDTYADGLESANVEVIEKMGSIPEVLRADCDEPTIRGHSCNPQAWSAAAIFLAHFEGKGAKKA